jgi:prepilin-type N-terminal cleavage/methylation domain-containing protein
MLRKSRRPDRAGFGLLEVLVALVVVGIGVTALQRLVTRSVATLGEDVRLTRAMLAAQTLLADAALAPPEPGVVDGATPDGLRFERAVTHAPHPALREVRVRVWPDAGAAPCELWEVIRVPPA